MKLYVVKSFVIVIAMISARNSMCMNNARPDQKQLNKQLFDIIYSVYFAQGKALKSYKRQIRDTLAQGASINAIEEISGESLLFNPIYNGHYALVKFLIGLGIDVNMSESKVGGYLTYGSSEDKMSPLFLAAVWSRNPIIGLLIDHGADVQKTLCVARKYRSQEYAQRIRNVFIQKVVEEKRKVKITQSCIANLDTLEKKAKRSLPEEIKQLIMAEAIK